MFNTEKVMQIQEHYLLPDGGKLIFTINIVGESKIITALQKKVISQAEKIILLEQELKSRSNRLGIN